MTLHKLLAVPTLLKHVYIKVYKQGLYNNYVLHIYTVHVHMQYINYTQQPHEFLDSHATANRLTYVHISKARQVGMRMCHSLNKASELLVVI